MIRTTGPLTSHAWTVPTRASSEGAPDRFEPGEAPAPEEALSRLLRDEATRTGATKLKEWDPGNMEVAIQQLLAQPGASTPDELRCLARCVCDTVESRDAALLDLMPERAKQAEGLSNPGRSAVFRLCMEQPDRPQFELDMLQELARLHAKASPGPAQKRLADDARLIAQRSFDGFAAQLLKDAKPTPVELLKALKTQQDQPDNKPQLASLLMPSDPGQVWDHLTDFPVLVAVGKPMTDLPLPPEDKVAVAQTLLGLARSDPSEMIAGVLNELRGRETSLVPVQKCVLEMFQTPATRLAVQIAEALPTGQKRLFYEAALAVPDAETPAQVGQMLQRAVGRGASLPPVWAAMKEIAPDWTVEAQSLSGLSKSPALEQRLARAMLVEMSQPPLEVALGVLSSPDLTPSEQVEAETLRAPLELRQKKHTGIEEQSGRVLIGGTVLRRRT